MRRNSEERVPEGDLKFEVFHLLLLSEAQFHHNVYSEGARQSVEGELDSESERLACDISFALTSSQPLGICLIFFNSQIKDLRSEGDGSTCVLCESK